MKRGRPIDSHPDRNPIAAYLSSVADRLPRGQPTQDILDELHDGLATASARHKEAGLPAWEAAQLAVREFGDPESVAANFVPEITTAHIRRVALAMLATGPVVGAAWVGATHTPGTGWLQQPAVLAHFAPALPVLIGCAVASGMVSLAATGRLSRRLVRDQLTAGVALRVVALCAVAVDSTVLAGAVALRSMPVGPAPVLLVAATLSAVRLLLAGGIVHHGVGRLPIS